MPRCASRLTLHVTEVRVQRLQEIGEADAVAEGVECIQLPDGEFRGGWNMYGEEPEGGGLWSSARDSYTSLWRKLNGPGSWDENPWVAACSFTVERGNIDQARPAP